MMGVFSVALHLLFWQGLSVALEVKARNSRVICPCHLCTEITSVCCQALLFHEGARDLNSGHHVFVVSTLSTSPFLQPLQAISYAPGHDLTLKSGIDLLMEAGCV